MKQAIKKLSYLALSLVIAGGVVMGLHNGFGSRTEIVQAGINHNFNGYAWSDMPTTSNEVTNPTGGTVGRGAGWIAFNNLGPGDSIDYGVTATPTGAGGIYNVSGNAWSEHVGWISFDASAGCPTNNSTNCQPRLEPTTPGCTSNCYYAFKGWARAMAYSSASAGGWDGWISFSSTNHTGSVAYGWSLNSSGNMSGSAWGGDVLGWINPYNLQVNLLLNNPTLVLDANPTSIMSSNPLVTDLTYKVNNWTGTGSPFSSCTFTTSPTSGTTTAGTPVHNTTLTTAANLPISTNRSVNNVRVYNPSSTHQTVYTLTCTPTAGGATVSDTATVTVTDPQPSSTITGPGCVINPGTSAQLVWTSANVTSCTIDHGVGSVSLNGNQAVSVGSTTNYKISCTGPYGSTSAQHTIAVSSSCQTTVTPGSGGTPIFNEV